MLKLLEMLDLLESLFVLQEFLLLRFYFLKSLRRNPIEDGAISGFNGQKSVPE